MSKTLARILSKHLIPFMVALLSPLEGYTLPTVVATINPIHALVSEVSRGVMEPILLIEGVSCIHDCMLKPSDTLALKSSDIVFYVNDTLEPFIQKLGLDHQRLVKLSEEVELLPARNVFDPMRHIHDIADMHIWLSPDNAKRIIKKVCDTLSDIDQKNAPTYKRNATMALKKIDQLITKVHAILKPVKSHVYVVTHDAYQYFEKYFGLQPAVALSSGHTTNTTVSALTTARKAIKKHNIKCIFTESPNTNEAKYRIFGDNIKVQLLDPIGHKKLGYFKIIEDIAVGFRKCLQSNV